MSPGASIVPPPMAHAGHWIADLLYLAPVVVVVGALLHQQWKDRRRGGGEPSA